jgi:TRAP-type C4-dicarboxylate transport system permease large subunit
MTDEVALVAVFAAGVLTGFLLMIAMMIAGVRAILKSVKATESEFARERAEWDRRRDQERRGGVRP